MSDAFEDEDYEQIKDFLCEEGTVWNSTGRKPHFFSHPNLWPEVRLWNTFVKRNLMPISHNQIVDRTRLVLIHTIMTGYNMNVGEILAQELAAACKNDKGILAFPCLITKLCRRAVVATSPGGKYTAEKTGWTRAVYMHTMDIADATPISVAMPTPATSPIHTTVAEPNEAGPSAPAEARPTPAASPPVFPVPCHTSTTSPTTTPAAMQGQQKIYTGLTLRGAAPESSIARQSKNKEQAEVPILSLAPTPAKSVVANRTKPNSPTRRKGKAPAGKTVSRHALSSPEEEEQLHQPAKRQRRYHIITADSDDDSNDAVPVAQPEKSVDPSLSATF
ncbi:hypothetical protein GQ457_16G016900 [Hibiscus cannabinus]